MSGTRGVGASRSGAEASAPFEVLWGDADPSGWIHNSRTARYCEQVEMALWRAAGADWPEMLAQGFAFPRVSVSTVYRRPLRTGDRGLVHCRVAEVGVSSVTLDFTLTLEGETKPSVEVRSTAVHINLRTERPIPLPPAVRAYLTGEQA